MKLPVFIAAVFLFNEASECQPGLMEKYSWPKTVSLVDFGLWKPKENSEKVGFLARADEHWSYWGDNGPENWSGSCNTGKHQSPIDIVTDDAIKTDLGSLKFTRYDFAFNVDVINTGHTIQLVTTGVPIHLKGGNLPFTYVLEQMHVHWNAEHTINGDQDALELHLVHYAKPYGNTSYAAEFEDGIAVVGVLFEISNEDNEFLEPILEAVKTVSSMSERTITRLQTKLIPSMLLPKDHSSYYRYHGSLTTPDCQESVIWTVLSNKMPVSMSQIEILRKVRTYENQTLAFNNRPIQKLGSRKVYHHLEGYSSARNLLPKILLLFFGIIVTVM